MSLTTLTLLRIRGIAATIVVLAIMLNPFATTAVPQTAIETVSDAAVEIRQKPQRHVPVRQYVRDRASRHGWSLAQWRAVVALVNLENRQWNVHAKNREGSSAYGLFQILKMPQGTPLREQVDRFIRYIETRYDGDPVAALRHHQQKGWY